MEFRSLASSSEGCCYVLTADGTQGPLLLEAGIPYRDIQVGTGFAVAYLAGCLITHCHGDHARSAGQVGAMGVDIYAHADTFPRLSKPVPTHRQKPVEEKLTYEVGGWTVMPFETMHDVAGSLGYFVGAPDGDKLLFLTDSAYSRYRFDAMTHIAIEANWSETIIRDNTARGAVDGSRFARTVTTHMSIERAIDFLKANDLSRCREIHLLHLSDANSDEAAFKRMVQEATGVPTYVAAKRTPQVSQ